MGPMAVYRGVGGDSLNEETIQDANHNSKQTNSATKTDARHATDM